MPFWVDKIPNERQLEGYTICLKLFLMIKKMLKFALYCSALQVVQVCYDVGGEMSAKVRS